MSFALINPDETFELYTDIREIRDGKTGQQFQTALKEAIPRGRFKFNSSKRCQVFKDIHHLKTVKDLCEIYFKDDWKTKDNRLDKPINYLRHLLRLHPDSGEDVISFYYSAVLVMAEKNRTDAIFFQEGLININTLKETYDRAYPAQ